MAAIGSNGGYAVPTNGNIVAAASKKKEEEEVFDGWLIADPVSNEAASSSDQVAMQAATPVPVTKGLSAEVALASDSCVQTSSELLAVLSAVAPETNGTARAALRLNAVIDKSGSMHGEKIRLVQKTLLYMLQHLGPRDALGLVEYDTHVKTTPMTLCDVEGRARLEAVLQKLRPGSQTNLSGGLLRGLELHQEGIQKMGQASAQQKFEFGNMYKQLSEEEAQQRKSFGWGPAPDGAKRIHEWTLELRFDNPNDAGLVSKVVYNLHETFRDPVVEVNEAPFKLTRVGWGTFPVYADMHLQDGRVLQLCHHLQFGPPETFSTLWKPLSAPEGFPEMVAGDDEQGVVRSTFLFTDGLANVGITKADDIKEAAEAKLQEMGDQRCTLSTFGFGADHDANLLQGLAEVGEGMYSCVESEDKIGAAFGEALGGLLSTTHQNVSLTLNLEPGVGVIKVLSAFPVQTPMQGPRGTQIAIEVGDLFAEERRDVLVMLSLPETEQEASQHLGTLSAKGFSVINKRTEKTCTTDLTVKRQKDVDTQNYHPQVLRQQCRYIVTEALDAANLAAQANDIEKARKLIREASDTVGRSPLTIAGDAACVSLLADLNECLQSLRHRADYLAKGSKMMNCMKTAHMKQRACYGQEFSSTYRNVKMNAMNLEFEAQCSK
eukprot:gnl/MRDRNA2_/MRDRNA2_93607_c0_seq1.p1 gnl/MRDRNA2_/MRDRNA2_93607_c0~~gnl/MRDRNA2_/MRDRNA2_93607_c0_seq1.p1  ORF type:complete len:662 (-),score=154.19 gnl/MRDRNA2_/MRDRNA2_93607_c0_seq1:202-2187(-)